MDAVATGLLSRSDCGRYFSPQRAGASINRSDINLDLHADEPAGDWRLSDPAAHIDAATPIEQGVAAGTGCGSRPQCGLRRVDHCEKPTQRGCGETLPG